MQMNVRILKLALVAALTAPALVFAAGSHAGGDGDGHGEAMNDMHEDMHGGAGMVGQGPAAGMPGDPSKVSRTVPVEMDDNMRFTPAQISVKAGETIRFFVVNKGKVRHEMVIGTAAELDEHAQMMRKMPGMQHAEANQLSLEPGQRSAIVWTFDKAGSFAFACMVPGHKEAGMVGKIVVN
ncbi:MAG: cupredoxin family protein [Burkholderiales bacterium]|nr:cupredoxin family protein [Burkholderiales bacterium]MDE2394951.1 cupredoxin family protein [Burkholderiales bacterium]MDE2455020.1 cupredoxin family protein [Burkholderiales bacterium]